jgi:hypothetical protein
MDTQLVRDGQIVERILGEHAQIPYAYGQVSTMPIFDRERHQYVLMDVGWEDDQRIHGCLVHVALRDGKVWIEYDGTEEGVAGALVAAGIPRERIVLAFHRPSMRPLTGFAVA